MTATGERVYDGRGDALENARLTMADGRLADDLRLGVTHFRVMAHVGRQNAARGWLRVSQSELAERWDVHRNTVNKAFRELVEWGYLWQRSQEDSGESFCLYKVALDNEIEPQRAPKASSMPERGECTSESAPPSGGGVQRQECTPQGGECSAESAHVHSGECTRVRLESAPPLYTTDKPTNADSPPNPPRDFGREGVLDSVLLAGLPEGTGHVRLCLARIATVLEIKHPKPGLLLAEIAAALKPEPEPVLDELAGVVIRERKKIVSVKCVLDCLAKAHAAVPPMTIRDGDESYAAWVAHYASNRGMLSVAKAHGFTVRSKWPPGYASRSPHALDERSGGAAPTPGRGAPRPVADRSGGAS